MDPLIFVLAVVVAAVVATLIGILVYRLRSGIAGGGVERIASLEADLARTRDEKSAVERQLATETERASRVGLSENALQEMVGRYDGLRNEKATADQDLATKTEAVSRLEKALEKQRIELEQTKAAHESAQRDVTRLRAENATATERLEQVSKATDEKLGLLTDAKERMTQEFRVLANGIMQTHGENFSKQNKEQIDTILSPLREKLTEFQQGIQISQVETTKERASLSEQIRLLSENSAKITSETNNLARALRGEAQTQGAWGEMILASILEKSGLREGEEYIVQQSVTGEEGQRLRPDVLVNLPGGQKIVIDLKVSLVAFDLFVNANEEAEGTAALGRHRQSMITHIRTLSGKDYHTAAGSHVDYVIMFVPIEGALATALTADPGLTAFAVENNVAIATPTTLMIALRTVNNVWQVERRNRNAEQIASRAGQLYEKLVNFVSDMTVIETSLNRAQKCYGDAMSKLSTGSGNLIRQAEQLKELGAKTRRSLPVSLTGNDNAEVLVDAESLPAEG